MFLSIYGNMNFNFSRIVNKTRCYSKFKILFGPGNFFSHPKGVIHEDMLVGNSAFSWRNNPYVKYVGAVPILHK